jgi:hypothetical protein
MCLNLTSAERFGGQHEHDPFVPFPLSADSTSIPRPPGCPWRLITGDDRTFFVGFDGRAGRHTSSAFWSSAQREGARARRGHLRPGARIRVLKAWYDFHILEARDRAGGLVWTVRGGTTHTEIGGERQQCTWDEGQWFNAGAWRIPYAHTGVLNYCKELGVPLEIFVNEADASYFYYEGATAGSLANKRVRLREVKADIVWAR